MTGGLLALTLAAWVVAEDERWVEARGPALRVVSDAGELDARRVLSRFEDIRAGMAVLLPEVPLLDTGPLLIVVARDETSLRALAPGWWETEGGIRPSALHLTGHDQTLVLVRADLGESDDESYKAAYWGLASSLLSANLRGLAPWASRGLAGFFAHTTVSSGEVVLGRTAVSHIRTLHRNGGIPVTDLVAVGDEPADSLDRERLEHFDAQSWALVHYLMLGDESAHRARLARYLVLCGKEPGAAGAAREALGDLAALDAALRDYVHRRAFPTQAIPAAVDHDRRPRPLRRLSAAEVSTLRAAVHLAGERLPDANACLAKALRLDPRLAWAHEVGAALAWAEGDAVATRAAATRALGLEAGRPVALRLRERAAGPPTVKAAERLCEAGDLEMCARLGVWLIDGEGTDPDPVRGVVLLDGACRGGNAEACRVLSWRLREGQGVPVDPVRSVALLEKACLAGDGQACLAAAGDHRTGRGVPVDLAAAVRMFEVACTRGEKGGCVALAWALQSGDGVAPDLERAAALYLDACQAGNGSACTRLGLLYLRPDGLPRDALLAKAMLTRGCGLGDARGCSHLKALNAAQPSAEESGRH